MALNLSKPHTFATDGVIFASEHNENYDALYNAFAGLEAGTNSLSKLPLDANPTSALWAAPKQYVDVYAAWRRPNLTWISITTVDVENNTGTANETKIVFPDGDARSVTENTGSTHQYRRLIITATASVTVTHDSGLRSGLTEATNTSYAVYAVKTSDDATKFVLIGDTTLPIQTNFSTLNSRYGTASWVYLGMIFNSDGVSATSDLVAFTQNGPLVMFKNALSSTQSGPIAPGIALTNSSGAATLTYTYAAGTAIGSSQIPNQIAYVYYVCMFNAVASSVLVLDAAGAYEFYRAHANGVDHHATVLVPATVGIRLANGAASSIAYDIGYRGYWDGVLGGSGSNPLL